MLEFVLEFLDVEANHGKDNDRDDSPFSPPLPAQ